MHLLYFLLLRAAEQAVNTTLPYYIIIHPVEQRENVFVFVAIWLQTATLGLAVGWFL